MRHRKLGFLCLLAGALSVLPARLGGAPPPQPAVFNSEASRLELSSLTGLWRFHTGDDPAWSSPSYDDRSWKLLRSDQGWDAQGYPQYSGFAWYRFRIQLPATGHSWSLLLPRIWNCYEVFANGQLLGGLGRVPPAQQMLLPAPHVFRLPSPAPHATTPAATNDVLIAIRVWSYAQGGGPYGRAWVGEPGAVERAASESAAADQWHNVDRVCLTLVFLLAGAAGLALFLLRPSETEYLWFSLYGFGNACEFGFALLGLATLSISARSMWGAVFFTIKDIAMILFAGRLLKSAGDRALRLSVLAAVAIWAIYTAWFERIRLLQHPSSAFSIEAFFAAVTLCDLVLYAGVIYTIARAIRRKTPDASLLLYPLCLTYAAQLFALLVNLASLHGWPWLHEHSHWFFSLTARPFPLSLDDLAQFLTQSALLGMLVLRFARTRRDEERLENELAAARVVQQVLIPEQTPHLPGFRVQTAYHPASQVGGDFFQIFPAAPGGVVVLVGDVSGKGMPAAMTVSLLVGAARTLAEVTDSPAAMLNGLNRRAAGHSSGGFTTCLCCRISADGILTLANAGHLAPYLDGRELEVASGLPLGLDAESVYEETTLHLPLHAPLTFLSDGVVEAKSASGELLGFQRACEMSARPADEIAQAAKDFGQEDDITVLTLTRQETAAVLTA